jgi:hypothetical protein
MGIHWYTHTHGSSGNNDGIHEYTHGTHAWESIGLPMDAIGTHMEIIGTPMESMGKPMDSMGIPMSLTRIIRQRPGFYRILVSACVLVYAGEWC